MLQRADERIDGGGTLGLPQTDRCVLPDLDFGIVQGHDQRGGRGLRIEFPQRTNDRVSHLRVWVAGRLHERLHGRGVFDRLEGPDRGDSHVRLRIRHQSGQCTDGPRVVNLGQRGRDAPPHGGVVIADGALEGRHGGRVIDLAQGRGGALPHSGVAVREGATQKRDGARILDFTQGPRRLQPYARVLVRERLTEGVNRPGILEVSQCASRGFPHARILVLQCADEGLHRTRVVDLPEGPGRGVPQAGVATDEMARKGRDGPGILDLSQRARRRLSNPVIAVIEGVDQRRDGTTVFDSTEGPGRRRAHGGPAVFQGGQERRHELTLVLDPESDRRRLPSCLATVRQGREQCGRGVRVSRPPQQPAGQIPYARVLVAQRGGQWRDRLVALNGAHRPRADLGRDGIAGAHGRYHGGETAREEVQPEHVAGDLAKDGIAVARGADETLSQPGARLLEGWMLGRSGLRRCRVDRRAANRRGGESHDAQGGGYGYAVRGFLLHACLTSCGCR